MAKIFCFCSLIVHQFPNSQHTQPTQTQTQQHEGSAEMQRGFWEKKERNSLHNQCQCLVRTLSFAAILFIPIHTSYKTSHHPHEKEVLHA